MDRRPLGNTGAELSLIGFGGILVMNVEPTEAANLVAEAVDRGVNYFDVAPSYGNAEERLGPALEPHRGEAFLACKTQKRTRSEAAAELRDSLRRMRTDHFDLYQLHAMTTREDLEVATGPRGALEALVEARDAGLIRHIGFSAHNVDIALELMDLFDFASVLFPLNWMEYFNAGFGPQVVEKAAQKGVGRLALKAMARQKWPEGADRGPWTKCWYEPCSEPREASLAVRFTLSQPITAAITPGHPELFRLALDTVEQFQPLTEAERDELQQRAQGLQPFFEVTPA
ncbi:MAG: putative oxidoreductase [Armatimonadetes bacterium]|jgi:aryl-alcohol dehydrogenase-like predicted oxidoreductase|nr:putative oxidoreductase [Armatimonadota bacterium]